MTNTVWAGILWMLILEERMTRFENGFDSYKNAINELENRNQDEYRLKGVIINYHHAIEVMFKHILYSRANCLIYSDQDKWVQSVFSKKIGENKPKDDKADHTVSFSEAVKRVFVVFNENIDSYAHNSFNKLSKLRNALTHDEFELNAREVEQIVVTLSPIVNSIMKNHLEGSERGEFIDYTSSEKYSRIFQELIGDNTEWHLTIITDLLNAYDGRDFSQLTPAEIAHLESTLSLMNCQCEYCDDALCLVNGEGYSTYISYLEYQIYEVLFNDLLDLKKYPEINDMFEKRNDIFKKAVHKLLTTTVSSRLKSLFEQWHATFDSDGVILYLLNNNSFKDNHTLFMYIQFIEKMLKKIQGCLKMKPEKMREEIHVDSSDQVTYGKIYSLLKKWFSSSGWHSPSEFKKSDENMYKTVNSAETLDKVYEMMNDLSIQDELIGTYANDGIIDNVNDFDVLDAETIVQSGDKITVVYNVDFYKETYFDHEFFDTGSYYGSVKVSGQISGEKFRIDEIKYLDEALTIQRFY